MELNTSQPQHSQIISKPSRNPIVLVVIALLVLGIGVVSVALWQRMIDLDGVRAELASTQHQLTQMNSSKNGGDLKDESEIGAQTTMYHKARLSDSVNDTSYVVTIKYLDENHIFARAHVEYIQTGEGVPKNTRSGKFDYYIFKKVTDNERNMSSWVMLAENPMEASVRDGLQKTYGVPADVLDLTKEKPA